MGEEEEYDSDSSSGSISILGSDKEDGGTKSSKRKISTLNQQEEEESRHSTSNSPSTSTNHPSENILTDQEIEKIPQHTHIIPSNGSAEASSAAPLPLPPTTTQSSNSDFDKLDFKVNLKNIAPLLVPFLQRLAPDLSYSKAVEEINDWGKILPKEYYGVTKKPRQPQRIQMQSNPNKKVELSSEELERAQTDSLIVAEAILAVSSLSPNDPRTLARFILGSLEEWDCSRASPTPTPNTTSTPTPTLQNKSSPKPTSSNDPKSVLNQQHQPPQPTSEPLPNIEKLNQLVVLIHQTENDASKPDIETFGLLVAFAQEFHKQAALCESKDGEEEFKVWKNSVSEVIGGNKKQVFRLELAQRVDLVIWAFGSPLAVALIPHLRGFSTNHSLRTCDRELFRKLVHFLLDGQWIDGVGTKDETIGQMAEMALRGLIAEALRIAERAIKEHGSNDNPTNPSFSHFLEKVQAPKKAFGNQDATNLTEEREEVEVGLIFQGHPIRKVRNEFAEKMLQSNKQMRRGAAMGIASLPDYDVRPRCSRGELAAPTRTIHLRISKSKKPQEWDDLSEDSKRMELMLNYSKALTQYTDLFQLESEDFLKILIKGTVNTIFENRKVEVSGNVSGKGKNKIVEIKEEDLKLNKDFFKASHKSTLKAVKLDLFRKKFGGTRRRNHVDTNKVRARKKIKMEEN